jgi:hypothetical protein
MQGWCVPDWCVPDRKFLDVAPLEQSVPWKLCPWPMCPDPGPRSVGAIVASVGLRRLMDQWGVWPASPTPLTRFIGLAPLHRMHAQPTHRTPPLRSAKAHVSWKSGVASLNQIKGMGWFGQGQIIQGTLCPRDATSKNFSVGDTSVGDGLTLHRQLLGRQRVTSSKWRGRAEWSANEYFFFFTTIAYNAVVQICT